MKQYLYRWIALCLALCVLLSAAVFATEEPPEEKPEKAPDASTPYEYPDDWSREALIFTVENGILAGDHHHRLNPEKNITRAEMAAVLVRMLGASGSTDLSAFSDVSANAWYYAELSAAVCAGIFTGASASKMEPDSFLTREQAVVVLSRAFGIAGTDRSSYTKFSDSDRISPYARNAISAMAKQGFLSGYSDGSMRPQSSITRAEIAQLVYNLFDSIVDTPESLPASGRALYRGAASLPDTLALDGSLVIGQPYAGTLSPADWSITGSLSVRCAAEVNADFTNLKVGQLVFAPSSGTLTANTDHVFLGGAVTFTGSAKTLAALSGMPVYNGNCENAALYTGAGLVLNGNASDIELSSKCSLHANGTVGSLTVGRGCTVTLEKDMARIEITADNVHLTLNGRVEQVVADGNNITIDGSGSIGEFSYYGDPNCSVAYDNSVNLWEKKFGEDYAQALSTVKTAKIPCIAQRDTTLYQSQGSGYLTTIAKGTVVYNEYWPSGSYMRVSTSSGQRGWVNRYHFFIDVDNTSFDGDMDYSEGTKSGFVNLRGYTSETEYLIWVSRYTQKVIIYTGSAGKWTPLKTCPCASGSSYTPTPEGIYQLFAKTWMWDFKGYIVNNVSLFNGEMAFHSYLLNYNGSPYNSTLGRPLSHGCIRMKPEDAAFIYNSIPNKTTVIVY